MPNLATVTLIGHLGRDPEIRYMPDGSGVCSFSIATSEKNRDQEFTTWWKINVWGKQAESCGQYLSKGRPVCVQGRVSLKPYTDRDGNERSSLEVNAQSVTFLGSRDDGDTKSKDELDAARQHATQQPQASHQAQGFGKDDDPNVPF